jgi:hypothetical protein
MIDRSRENVRDCFDSAMRVPGETREVIFGIVVPEIIKKKKWIEIGSVPESEGTAQMDAGSLECGFGLDYPLDRT